jgi:hypothetical protein
MRSKLAAMKQVFKEQLICQLLISTPSQLTELDVERQLKNCHWDFEIELAMNIAGVVEVVETPEAEQRGSEETVWACVCHIAVNLSPWEPLRKTDYDPDNTLPLVSATPSLPDNWEFVEWSLLSY